MQSSSGVFDASPVVPAPSEAASPTWPEDAARVAVLLECARGMLLGAGKCPRVPPDRPDESQSTNGLLIDARRATSKLWEAERSAIKAACAPQLIDEMDCYGQLLAVVVAGRLLDAEEAGDIGRRAHVQQGRAASKWKAEQGKAADAARRAQSAAAAKPELAHRVAAAERAGTVACAAVLAKLYDLKLPPRKVAVRKRKARSPEDEAAAEAELRLQKAKKAEAAAEAAHVAAATRCDGVRRRVDALGRAPDIFAMMERQNRDEDPPSRQECVAAHRYFHKLAPPLLREQAAASHVLTEAESALEAARGAAAVAAAEVTAARDAAERASTWSVAALMEHFDDGECLEEISASFWWWGRVQEMREAIRDDDLWGAWKHAQIDVVIHKHRQRLDAALPPEVRRNLELMKAETKARDLAAVVAAHRAELDRAAEAAMEAAAAEVAAAKAAIVQPVESEPQPQAET